MENKKPIILRDRLTNLTPLQKKIDKAITGYELGEVIHAFEVIKLALLIEKP